MNDTVMNSTADARLRARCGAGLRVSSLTLLPLLVLGVAAPLGAAPPRTGKPGATVVTPRPSHASLAEARKNSRAGAAAERATPPTELKKVESGLTGSLIERSAVLSHDGNWTIVPKEAILHIPKGYAARVNGERQGELLPWPVFLQKHRTWLHLHQVNMEQARGESPLPVDSAERFNTLGQVVVAVSGKDPISVKQPKGADPRKPVASGPAR